MIIVEAIYVYRQGWKESAFESQEYGVVRIKTSDYLENNVVRYTNFFIFM